MLFMFFVLFILFILIFFKFFICFFFFDFYILGFNDWYFIDFTKPSSTHWRPFAHTFQTLTLSDFFIEDYKMLESYLETYKDNLFVPFDDPYISERFLMILEIIKVNKDLFIYIKETPDYFLSIHRVVEIIEHLGCNEQHILTLLNEIQNYQELVGTIQVNQFGLSSFLFFEGRIHYHIWLFYDFCVWYDGSGFEVPINRVFVETGLLHGQVYPDLLPNPYRRVLYFFHKEYGGDIESYLAN